MRDIKAVLFDLDGTLLDSMDVWEKVSVRLLKNRGLSVPSDYVETLGYLSFQEAAIYTAERFSLQDSPDAIIDQWFDLAACEYGHRVVCKPNAKTFLSLLKAGGYKLGVVTDLPKRLYAPALTGNGIDTLFDTICGAEEAPRGKPSPDGFLSAAFKLNVKPSECVVFEDTLQGVLGAKAAGMKVYGIYDSYSEQNRTEIQKIADGYMDTFKEAMKLKL